MASQSLPNPQSLRLPRDLDAQVRVFAKSISRKENGARINMNKALLALAPPGSGTVTVLSVRLTTTYWSLG